MRLVNTLSVSKADPKQIKLKDCSSNDCSILLQENGSSQDSFFFLDQWMITLTEATRRVSLTKPKSKRTILGGRTECQYFYYVR